MRLDHVAYRVADRHATAAFFCEEEGFGYRIQTEFDLNFKDGSTARCVALEPPEKTEDFNGTWMWSDSRFETPLFHLAPEIFVSDGTPDSIVGKWVAGRDGIGGVHHMAYQVDSVKETMAKWKEKGWAEFADENPLTCPDDELVQIFTVPHKLTGMIYEFIERGEHGFCQANVQGLMESTKNFK